MLQAFPCNCSAAPQISPSKHFLAGMRTIHWVPIPYFLSVSDMFFHKPSLSRQDGKATHRWMAPLRIPANSGAWSMLEEMFEHFFLNDLFPSISWHLKTSIYTYRKYARGTLFRDNFLSFWSRWLQCIYREVVFICGLHPFQMLRPPLSLSYMFLVSQLLIKAGSKTLDLSKWVFFWNFSLHFTLSPLLFC